MEKRLKEINERKLEIRKLITVNAEMNLDEIQSELEKLNSEEQELRTKLEIANQINLSSENIEIEKAGEKRNMNTNKFETLEYRNAFMNYVVGGQAIAAEFRSVKKSAPDNGAVIPTTVLNKVIEKIEATGNILSLVTKTAYKGGLSIPTSNVKPVATWVAEGSGSDKQNKTTGSVVFAYNKLRCAVAVSFETDNLSLSAFETTIINNIAEAMTKALEQAIISGTGEGQPFGIIKETAATDQNIEVAKIDYKTLVSFEAALPSAYENESVYVMTKKTFMEFVAMTDTTGQPIARVNFGVNGKVERSLLGRQVVLCDYLPSFATATAGQVFAFIFKMSDYVLNTSYQISIKKYEDNDTDDQVTKAIMLADGKVIDNNSLVLIKKKA